MFANLFSLTPVVVDEHLRRGVESAGLPILRLGVGEEVEREGNERLNGI